MEEDKQIGLNWRHSHELHKQMITKAKLTHRSLNEYITYVVEKDIKSQLKGRSKKHYDQISKNDW